MELENLPIWRNSGDSVGIWLVWKWNSCPRALLMMNGEKSFDLWLGMEFNVQPL
jgi:hypothetical protein